MHKILRDKLFAQEYFARLENINEQRKDQIATGDRSDKIRTYNWPQSRITGIRFQQISN